LRSVLLHTIDGVQLQYDSNWGGLNPWEAIPCLCCGVCCSRWQAPLNREEMALIAEKMSISLRTFIRRYAQKYPFKRGEYLLRHDQQGCIFLRYENGLATCVIHDVKPEACRRWTPSLSHSECRQGLSQRGGQLLLPGELYPEGGELNNFMACLSAEKVR